MSRGDRSALGHLLAAHLSTPGRRGRLAARLTGLALAALAVAVPLLATALLAPASPAGAGEATVLLAVTCLALAATGVLLDPAVLLLLLAPAPTRGPAQERTDAAPGWAPVSCPRTPSRPRAPGRR